MSLTPDRGHALCQAGTLTVRRPEIIAAPEWDSTRRTGTDQSGTQRGTASAALGVDEEERAGSRCENNSSLRSSDRSGRL